MALDDGMFLLGLQTPSWPEGPGYIQLPEVEGESPAGAVAMLIGLLFGAALASFGVIPPPKTRKMKLDDYKRENKRVVKVTDVRIALEETITGRDIINIIGRYFSPLHEASKGWFDISQLERKRADEAIEPFIDKLVNAVMEKVLQQDNPRVRLVAKPLERLGKMHA